MAAWIKITFPTYLILAFITGIICPTTQQTPQCPIQNTAGCICQLSPTNDYWTINCASKGLQQIPEWTTPRSSQRIKSYFLQFNNIEQARGNHFDGIDVEFLDLSNNRLKQSSFLSGVSPFVKHLYLDNNPDYGSHLATVQPNFIFNLTVVETIKLDSIDANHFDYLSNATNLETLQEFYGRDNNLAANSLKVTTFSKMTNLTVLDLGGNSIPDLEWIRTPAFISLQKLDLKRNAIQEFLPQHLDFLASLKELDLSQNDIQILRETTFLKIRNLTTIRTIDLSGNPIRCTCEELWFEEFLTWAHEISGRVTVVLDPDDENCIYGLPAQCSSTIAMTTNMVSERTTPNLTGSSNGGMSTGNGGNVNRPPPVTTVQPQGLSESTIIIIAVLVGIIALGVIIAIIVVVVIRNRKTGGTTTVGLPAPPQGRRVTVDSQYRQKYGVENDVYLNESADKTGPYYSYIAEEDRTAPDGSEEQSCSRHSYDRIAMPLPPTPNETDGYLVPNDHQSDGYIRPNPPQTDGYDIVPDPSETDGYVIPIPSETDGYVIPIPSETDGYIEPLPQHNTDDTYQELSPHDNPAGDYSQLNLDKD